MTIPTPTATATAASSLAECLVPMAVLGPKGQAQPTLGIESVGQVVSVSAGEPLTLEVSVVLSIGCFSH